VACSCGVVPPRARRSGLLLASAERAVAALPRLGTRSCTGCMRVPQQSSRLVGRRQLRFCADAGEEAAQGGRARPRSTSFLPSRGQRRQFDIDEAARERWLFARRSLERDEPASEMSWPSRTRCLPLSAPGAAAAPCHPVALLVSAAARGARRSSRVGLRESRVPGGGEEQQSQRSCGSSACGARRRGLELSQTREQQTPYRRCAAASTTPGRRSAAASERKVPRRARRPAAALHLAGAVPRLPLQRARSCSRCSGRHAWRRRPSRPAPSRRRTGESPALWP
jgi:hypothetical protein